MRQNPSTQSRSKYDAMENQYNAPSAASQANNGKRIQSRDIPPKYNYNDQYDKPPSNRGVRPYQVANGIGGGGG